MSTTFSAIFSFASTSFDFAMFHVPFFIDFVIIDKPNISTNKHTAAPVTAFIKWIFPALMVPKEASMERCNVSIEAATSAYPIFRIVLNSGDGFLCCFMAFTIAIVIL